MEEYILSEPHVRNTSRLKLYDLKHESIDLQEVKRIENWKGVRRKIDFSMYTKVIAPMVIHLHDKDYFKNYSQINFDEFGVDDQSLRLNFELMRDELNKRRVMNKGVVFDSIGLAKRFSRLETDEDITLFAEQNGFLGIGFVSDPKTKLDNNNSALFMRDPYRDNEFYNSIHFEPIEVWKWHIQITKKLIQLYDALSRSVRNINHNIDNLITFAETKPYESDLHVLWKDGNVRMDKAKISKRYENDEHESYREAAKQALITHVTQMTKGAINTEHSEIFENNQSKLGFKIKKKVTTPYLLAAIYYDLGRMIDENEEVGICKSCGVPLETTRSNAQFCGKRCTKRFARKYK